MSGVTVSETSLIQSLIHSTNTEFLPSTTYVLDTRDTTMNKTDNSPSLPEHFCEVRKRVNKVNRLKKELEKCSVEKYKTEKEDRMSWD